MFTRFALRLFQILLFSLLAAGSVQATDHDLQQWTVITATGRFAKESPWRWYLEAQPRIGDDVSHIERLLLRGALGYSIKPGVTLWAGYGWTPLFLDGNLEPRFSDENRLWQQLSIDDSLSGVVLLHRIRLEQRFIEGVEEVGHRFRYLIRASQEICPDTGDGALGVTGYNELFLNLTGTSASAQGFDRDRFFLGPYLQRDDVRFEFGYVGEFSERKRRAERMIHALTLGVNFTF